MPPAEVVRPRHFDWTETEALAGRLAARLPAAAAARDLDLAHATFVAIPRGGLFVLGMLSYRLDLDPRRIAGLLPKGSSTDAPLVLVDDCALSGARLAAALDRLTSAGSDRPVIVAHLHSHPALRRAVEAAEPRVAACVAAEDLAERSDLPPAALDGFAERWRERLPGRRYWLGALEPVAYPWSEPESVWWNARDERLEDGWRRVSPRCCLRSRAELGLPAGAGAAGAPFDLAPGVLWTLDRTGGADGNDVERLRLRGPDDRLYGFEGTALEIWRALLSGGGREAAARHLTERYEVDGAEARRDVDEMIDDLLGRGLLVSARSAP